ncbi:MAG: WG repeat-containing protein [Kiritimatiellaeota bacterium]|nr:WG repeat-containing protein [Kiritimatiellota bacterium]
MKPSVAQFGSRLLPFHTPGGLWGYMDGTGRVVLPPAYDFAAPFAEGLAAVRKDENGLFGHMRPDGSFAIKPAFSNAGGFYLGVAEVETPEGRGFINREGGFLPVPKLDYMCYPGYTGVAFACVGGKWALADITGKFLTPPEFDDACGHDECGWARVRKGGETFFIDMRGATVLAPSFDCADCFYGAANGNGNAVAVVGKNLTEADAERCAETGQCGKYGAIDRTGELALPLEYECLTPLSEGLMGMMENGKYGFINLRGDTIIEPRFDNITPFDEGYAGVCVGGKWGVITHSGEYLIKPEYPDAVCFRDGYAAIWNDGDMFHVDVKGRVVRPVL